MARRGSRSSGPGRRGHILRTRRSATALPVAGQTPADATFGFESLRDVDPETYEARAAAEG